MPPVEVFFWHWIILAIILMAIEVLAPGMFFLWLSISAAIVGGIVFFFPPLSFTFQLLLFAVFSIVSAWGGRNYFNRHSSPTDQPNLNRRAEYYIGRRIILDQPILNGSGKIKIDDILWKISGDDCAAGTLVQVKGLSSGNVLEVEVLELSKNP